MVPEHADPLDVGGVVESLSLRDPGSGTILVQLDDRAALEPEYTSVAGGREATLPFTAFTSHPAYDPTLLQDYDFVVSFGDDSENQCDGFGHGEGKLRLSVPCDCAGHYSFDLAVVGATTVPAGPIPEAQLFDIAWTDVYNFVPCVDNTVTDSGEFQAEVHVSGPMGDLPPVFVEAASMSPARRSSTPSASWTSCP
jgi:hypothetical protein